MILISVPFQKSFQYIPESYKCDINTEVQDFNGIYMFFIVNTIFPVTAMVAGEVHLTKIIRESETSLISTQWYVKRNLIKPDIFWYS